MGTEGARARRTVAARAPGCDDRPRGARVFLRSGRSDASRGEEGRRREGGWPGGGRAEGGAQNPGGGFEGQRGREAGSVGGEGEEARASAGPGPGPERESAKGERKGRRRGGSAGSTRTPACALSLALGRPPSPRRAFPLFSVRAWSPRRCVTTPRLARAGKQLQKFPQTSRRGGTRAARPGGAAARGRPRQPDPGRGRPLYPAFLWPSAVGEHPLPSRLGDPSPGPGAEGRSPGLGHRGEDWGRGRQGPCHVPSANTCTSCCSIS